nr:DNA primase [Cryptomonas paramecium]
MLNEIFILKNNSFLCLQKKNYKFEKISKQTFFPMFCNFKSLVHDIISKDQFKFKEKGKSSYIILCPFHREKTPSFHIEQEKGLYYCFGCGESGNLYTFIKKISQKKTEFDKSSIQDILHHFNQKKKKFSTINKNNSYLISHEFAFSIKTECDFCKEFLYNNLRLVLYVETRGVSKSVLNLYKIGYSYMFRKDSFNTCSFKSSVSNFGFQTNYKNINFLDNLVQNKIVMPIFDEKGIVIGFGKRSIESSSRIPKYVNSQDSPIFKKQRCVYSSYHFKIINKFKPRIGILVEGYMDFTTLSQNGIRFSVASLGTSINDFHIEKIFSFSKNKHIIISFDWDKPGLTSTRIIVFDLIYFVRNYQFKTSFSYCNEYKDPDELIYFKGGSFFTNFILNHIKPGLIWVENLCFRFLSQNKAVDVNSIFEAFFILPKNLKNFNSYYFTIVCNNVLLKKECIFSSKVKYFYYKNIYENTFDLRYSRKIFQKYMDLSCKKKKLDYFDSTFFLNCKLTKYFFLVFLFHIKTDFIQGSTSVFFYQSYSKYYFHQLYQKNMYFKINSNTNVLMHYWSDIFFRKNSKKMLFENVYDYFLKTFDVSQHEISNSHFTLKYLSYFFLSEKIAQFSDKKKTGIRIFSKNWFMMYKTVCLKKNKINIFNEKIKFLKNSISYFESQQFLFKKSLTVYSV